MEGRCRKCNELIFDTEKLDELPNVLECQHCHHMNILRRAKPTKPKEKRKPASKPIKPAPAAEVAPEATTVVGAAPMETLTAPGGEALIETENPEGEE